jgi:hypothetical protein
LSLNDVSIETPATQVRLFPKHYTALINGLRSVSTRTRDAQCGTQASWAIAAIQTGDMQWLRLPSAISKATKEGTFTVQQDFRFGRAVSIFHPAKASSQAM